MAGSLREEYAVEKQNLQKLLTGARMVEFCYGEIFSLFFEQGFCCERNQQYYNIRIPMALRIDAPCWFGKKEEWMAKAETFGNGGESADCLLACELARLRYQNLIDVEKVDFMEDHMEITFLEGNTLSIPYESESDCEWYLEEVGQKKESERMVISCSGRELFQNNIEKAGLGSFLQKYFV